MAQEVAAQLTATQLETYGNIILNGYSTTGPNTTGKLAWQYAETATAPAPLPVVTSYRPALKGWTTNYYDYYTQLPPNSYNQVPGNPTNFEYVVHSFSQPTGPITVLGGNGTWLTPGTGYTPGTYPNVALTGGTGTGATANIVVAADPDPLVVGYVQKVILVNPGTGYTAGDALSATFGGGSGFTIVVGTIDPVDGTGNAPRWAQSPRRFYQNLVNPFVPPFVNQQAIQYSFIYPVADNPNEPPIDALS